MIRAKWLILLILLASLGASAQVVSSITIGTTATVAPEPTFYVDGVAYNRTQTFLWSQGSRHSVSFPEDIDPTTQLPIGYQSIGYPYFMRWAFSGWADNAGVLQQGSQTSQTLIADPSITSLTATVSVTYMLTIVYSAYQPNDPSCFGAPGDDPNNAPRSGIFYVAGVCYSQGAEVWVPAGPISLKAYAYPGFAFAGWQINGQPLDPSATSFNLTGYTVLTPTFVTAKRVQFRTNPLGLSVVVDHGVVATPLTAGPQQYTDSNSCTPSSTAISGAAPIGYTPLCTGDFDFTPGSSHQVAAPTPQQDAQGNYWVFSGFSDGLGQNSTYTTDDNTGTPDTVFANFTPGVQAVIFTLPTGLPILVDGNPNAANYTYIWAQGDTHQVTAPATLTDSQGRVFSFVSWSNGGAATQSITMPTNSANFYLWATYQLEGQAQITSNPPGLPFTVNGQPCTTPCSVNQSSGAQVSVTIPASVPGVFPGVRHDFDSWSNGSTSTTLQLTFTQGVQAFTANYHTSYLLKATANPASAATIVANPPSPDGYYRAGTGVAVTATPKSGYNFTRWAGDYTVPANVAYLSMTVPYTIVAMLSPIPTTPTATTINAAGPTPDGSIAPGSLISIFGQNFGTQTQIGPTNPLQQSLAGVAVTADNLIFPLWFVSAGQINAQVPWELPPGQYTLTVHSSGLPDVSGPITVSRNAPGVYYTESPTNQPLAVAVHQDWTLITPASPARRGEYVTIYVNGLGPVNPAGLDGFPTRVTPLTPAVDPVSVNINGSLTLTPYWAGASPGTNGTDVVILQIADPIPTATTLNLSITANGKTSSVVQLPVQ